MTVSAVVIARCQLSSQAAADMIQCSAPVSYELSEAVASPDVVSSEAAGYIVVTTRF